MTWLRLIFRFVTRRVHALEVEWRDKQIAALTTERDYWRARAEQLIDAGLARAGAIHEPTMVERRPPTQSMIEQVTGALAVMEIDSSKRKAG